MATRTGRSKSKRAGTAKRRTTSSKAGAKRAGARSKAVKTAAKRPAKSAAAARNPQMASSQQQQGKPDGGMYLIFQSRSDEKIYTIRQADFGPAVDSQTANCILGYPELLRSNRSVVFAILVSADDEPFKTCGPSPPRIER